MDHLQAADVTEFCESLASTSLPGVPCGFYALYMYCLHDNGRWLACKDALRGMLLTVGFVENLHDDTMLAHAWQDAASKLLLPDPPDTALASHIAHEIVESAGKERFSYSAGHYVTPVLTILLRRYFDSTWPVVGAALISDDWKTSFSLTNVLGNLHDKNVGAALIADFPLDFLLGWCNQHQPKAPRTLARITPVIQTTNSGLEWHPVAKMLLDHFGQDPRILSELSSNWGTFGWSGSLIPYFEQQLTLLNQLADHPLHTVRRWQVQNAAWTRHRIEVERNREEEERLRSL
jgi:hypothetical protein